MYLFPDLFIHKFFPYCEQHGNEGGGPCRAQVNIQINKGINTYTNK